MPLFHSPPPPAGSSVIVNGEVTPDIVFIISRQPDGSSPLGYFCSTGGQARSIGWLSFAANTDTWIWFNNPPAPPPAPPQYNDTNWPGTFYLVPQTAPGWTPPAAPSAGWSTAAYSSAGDWTGAASPTGNPSWLLTLAPAPAGMENVGYVQLVNGVRTWFKSGTIAANNSWAGNYIAIGSGGTLKLSQPSSPGSPSRWALVTTKIP